MYRVGISTDKGRIEAKNFSTRDEVDDYILSFSEEEQILHYRIEQDGEVIETEQGRKK